MMEQILLIFCTFDWWLTERGKRKESKLGQQFAFRSARFVTRLEMRKILPAEIRLLFYHFSLFILSVLLVIILKYILLKQIVKYWPNYLNYTRKLGPNRIQNLHCFASWNAKNLNACKDFCFLFYHFSSVYSLKVLTKANSQLFWYIIQYKWSKIIDV